MPRGGHNKKREPVQTGPSALVRWPKAPVEFTEGEVKSWSRIGRAVMEAGSVGPGDLVLAERLASYIHMFTLYWSVRPYGAGVLLAAADAGAPGGASLYLCDPAGEVHRYHGAALGKGRAQAKTEIERLKLAELSCRDAVTEVAKIIHRCHDEKDKAFECELSWLCEESGWQHARVPAQLAADAIAAAKAALEAAGMED